MALRTLWQKYSSSPLFWILVAAALLRTASLGWGLPASDGWDDDGVAPRNFLVGLAETYTPGHHFTYPPLHMFLLGILSLPGIVVALFHAASLTPRDVIAEMIHVPYMTFFAVVARLVSIAFSLATIVVVGKMAALLGGRRAGLLAAAAVALNGGLTYYGQVTNLDGPALFWACLSLYGFMRVMANHDLKSIRWAMLAAAAAVTTKDQTYAIFLLSLPAGLALWLTTDPWPRQNGLALAKRLALWGIIALVAILFIDGALINPAGFADRLALLTGSASADYAKYQANTAGRLMVAADMAAYFPRYYPAPAILLALLGLAALRRKSLASSLMPLLAALSFTLAFNFVALRSETRFVLPQSVLLAIYLGLGAEWLLAQTAEPGRRIARLATILLGGVLAIWAGAACIGVVAAFWGDPRYDAEAWLGSHVRRGDPIEIYGLNAYLPRLPDGATVSRVSPKPLKGRNPLPGVTEILQPYEAIKARNPRFLVVTGYWVKDYLVAKAVETGYGRRVPKVREVTQQNIDARRFFGALFAGRGGYRLVHQSGYHGPGLPDIQAYESLKQTVYIFERGSK